MGSITICNNKLKATMEDGETNYFDFLDNPALGVWKAKDWMIEKILFGTNKNKFEIIHVDESVFDYAKNKDGFTIKEINKERTIVPEGMTIKRMNFLYSKEIKND